MKQKFSLFLLEKSVGGWGSELTQGCFEFAETFDTLEEAQSTQKGYKLKTLIIPTY